MKRTLRMAVLGLLLTGEALGQGTVLWKESVNGPLSNDRGAPTPLGSLRFGTNQVFGSVQLQPDGSGWLGFDDYFSFVVPAGQSLSAIYLTTDNQRIWAWIGDPGFSSQLGFVSNPANGNLLPQMGITAVAPNTYGMYIANQDAQSVLTVANYRLDFFTQSVPEPSTICLLVAGAGLIGFHRWTLVKGRT